MTSNRQPFSRWPGLRTTVAGAVLAALTCGVVIAAVTAGAAGAVDTRTEGLSASEVASKLGLARNTDKIVVGCNDYVGAEGPGGYCLDDLPQLDPWTINHIATQLQGYVDNSAMHAYVDAVTARDLLAAKNAGSAEVAQATREMLDLQSKLSKA